MTGQQLKNSILQMAIQGKLVPQDPHDEPASVLLERIREEKKRLVKEGKIKKKDLEETPISEEEKPFDIPESWVWVRINDVVTFATNLVNSSMYPNYVHIAPDNIEKGTGKLLFYKTVAEDKVISNNHLFYKGQIIYSKIRPLLRKAIIAPCDGLCSADMYPLETSLDIKYLLHLLLSSFFNSQVAEICSSRVKMPKINQEEMSKILLPLPPLSEQRRIVEKLESLMPLIESYGKSQEALNALNASLPEKLRQSILQEAIQGHLVPQDPNEEPASVLLERIRAEKARLVKEGKLKKKDLEEKPISPDEIPFDIPEGWVWSRMRDLCNFATPNKKDSHLVCLDARYLRGKGEAIIMTRGNYVDKGQYIILVDGENSGEVFITPCEGFLGSTFKELLLTTDGYFDYIKFIFLMIKEELRQNKRGAAIPHLDKTLFFEHLVPLPPLSEQRRIVTKLEELLQEIDKLKA